MPYVFIPLDVRFGRDPKVRALTARHGTEGFAAAALYLLMACHCRESETDGLVTDEEVGALAHGMPEDTWRRLVKLLEADLIEPAEAEAKPGLEAEAKPGGQASASSHSWIVRSYLKRNGTREEHEARAAELSEWGRRGGTTPRVFPGRSRRKPRLSQVAKPGLDETRSPGQAQEVEVEVEVNSSARRARGAGAGAGAHEADATPERDSAWTDLGGGAASNQWTTPPRSRSRRDPGDDHTAAGRHPSARTVAEVLARPDGAQPPATDEQRRKRHDDLQRDLAERASAAAAARTADEPPEPPEPFTGLTPPHYDPASADADDGLPF